MGYPRDAGMLRDEIRDYLRKAVADEGSSMDTGGGMGSADLWVVIDGREYFISIKGPRQVSPIQ